jgi:hypothetical protein
MIATPCTFQVFCTSDPAKVWVTAPSGEGGEFPADEVAAAMAADLLESYFWENF